jgi:hypothetical protein
MAKTGRNDPCHCGSGRKYKKCCEAGDRGGAAKNHALILIVGGALVAAIAIGIVAFTTDPAPAGVDNVRIWDPAHGHYHNAAGVQVP